MMFTARGLDDQRRQALREPDRDRTAPCRAYGAWPSRRRRRRSDRKSPSAALPSISVRRRRRQLRLLEFELRTSPACRGRASRDRPLGLRAHHRGVVLLQRDALLRLHLRDLRVDCFSSDCFSCMRWRSEVPSNSTRRRRPSPRRRSWRADDLQLPCLHRRGQDDRLRRADLAADLQVVDKLPLVTSTVGTSGTVPARVAMVEPPPRSPRSRPPARRFGDEGASSDHARLTLRAMTDLPGGRRRRRFHACSACRPRCLAARTRSPAPGRRPACRRTRPRRAARPARPAPAPA